MRRITELILVTVILAPIASGSWEARCQDATASAIYVAECAVMSMFPIVGDAFCNFIDRGGLISAMADCGQTTEEKFREKILSDISNLSANVRNGLKTIMNNLNEQNFKIDSNSIKLSSIIDELDETRIRDLWKDSIHNMKYIRYLFGRLNSLPNHPGWIDKDQHADDFKDRALRPGKESLIEALFHITEMINGGNLFRPESIYDGSQKHKAKWCEMRTYFEDLLRNGYTMYFVGLAMKNQPIYQKHKDDLLGAVSSNNFHYHKHCEDGETPKIFCRNDEQTTTGTHYNDKCWYLTGIAQTDSKSSLEIFSPGRYFVTVHSYITAYKNKYTYVALIQNRKGKDSTVGWLYSHHKADLANSYTGSSPATWQKIMWFDRGDHFKRNVTNMENGKITNTETTMFKLLSSTYLDCTTSTNKITTKGSIHFDLQCNAYGIDIIADKYFKVKSTGVYFVCLSAVVRNFGGTKLNVQLHKRNEDFGYIWISSQHQGDENKDNNRYSGGGLVSRCKISRFFAGQELDLRAEFDEDDEATKVHITLTKLYEDSNKQDFVSCAGKHVARDCSQCHHHHHHHHHHQSHVWCTGDCEWKDGKCMEKTGEIPWFRCSKHTNDGVKGTVTFDSCDGENGAVEEQNKNKFKILKTGKYYVGLSVMIKTYAGGKFCVAVTDNDTNFIHLTSDHEDNTSEFDGSGSYHRDQIRYFSLGDIVRVTIHTADSGSKLVHADLSLFRLP